MLFPKRLWPGVADGSVTLAFRRWENPRARPGARHRTPAGVIEIDSVKTIEPALITDRDARRAGAKDAAEIRGMLARRSGTHYRIAFHYAGADPRIELRGSDRLSDADWATLADELDGIDRATKRGPWTVATLELIRDHPEVAAAELAESVGRARLPFKADVRRLKELGLTESLRPGYRLSPRGAGLLDYLSRRATSSPSGRGRSAARG
jgi:hypothetical protein